MVGRARHRTVAQTGQSMHIGARLWRAWYGKTIALTRGRPYYPRIVAKGDLLWRF